MKVIIKKSTDEYAQWTTYGWVTSSTPYVFPMTMTMEVYSDYIKKYRPEDLEYIDDYEVVEIEIIRK